MRSEGERVITINFLGFLMTSSHKDKIIHNVSTFSIVDLTRVKLGLSVRCNFSFRRCRRIYVVFIAVKPIRVMVTRGK